MLVKHFLISLNLIVLFPPLSLRGYVCVIVNVASKWGKTRVNYTQLAGMHASYAEKGLRILGFPCNQFGGQVTLRAAQYFWIFFFFCYLKWCFSELHFQNMTNFYIYILPILIACTFFLLSFRNLGLKQRLKSLPRVTMQSSISSVRLRWTVTMLTLCGSGWRHSPKEKEPLESGSLFSFSIWTVLKLCAKVNDHIFPSVHSNIKWNFTKVIWVYSWKVFFSKTFSVTLKFILVKITEIFFSFSWTVSY